MMTSGIRYWLAATVLGAVAAVSSVGAAGQPPGVALGIKGRANATPTIAAVDRFVCVVWGATAAGEHGGATDVYAATSRDGGWTFAAPVRVNDVAGDASLGGEQPPHVSLVRRSGRDPEIVVVWTAKTKDGTRLLVARSNDGGASFRQAAPFDGAVAKGNRGWESTTTDRDGHVVAVWLDHRETVAAGGASMQHEGHDHSKMSAPKANGAERAQLSKLFFARLDDAASAQAVTGGVCYCCKTAVATGPDGWIYAAWRHVYPGNIRDIAFTRSGDGGRTFAAPVRVSDDRWALDGCPENGPAIAVDTRNAVHVVWPTLVSGLSKDSDPTLGLFYAATRDGRQFSVRQRLSTEGVPRHPQIVATSGQELIAVWDEDVSGGRRIVLGRAAISSRTDALHFSREIVSPATRSEYPVVAEAATGVVLAWTEGADRSVIRVERMR